MANEGHVTPTSDQPGDEGKQDDVSKKIEDLEAQVAQLAAERDKRDALISKTQSDRDKLAKQLEREQQRRERAEASRQKQIDKLPTNEQTEYLQRMAAQEHQRATRFELAHQYSLDPTELEGEYPSYEAMKLHAMELATQKGAQSLEDKVTRLTDLVGQLAAAQKQAQGEPAPVTPDAGGPRGRGLPPREELDKFDQVAKYFREEKGDHRTAVQIALAKIHRDPSKVMGSSVPGAELPPELLAKQRR